MFNSFPEWLHLVFNQHGIEIHNTVMVCWALWKNRNDLVWNQKSLDSSEVFATALMSLTNEDLFKVNLIILWVL